MMSSGTDTTGGVVSTGGEGEVVASTVSKNDLLSTDDFVVGMVAIMEST
jgi:hypothetical protein